ncbi:creatininase family protein [Gordonia hirsuta DSM 44140 = NBRC 16056]|uniref:Creatininase family protein n=1 Tax=Gordonia hirsuta DSM 44140 = NBRC 16056 TaxID=1121927 RepID=L7L5T3_9ACTN|nr:mycofactocin biosynthesis peptidyl-dipeptidase MftE [Gordonia hirsuta]GAC56475.1 creatininase family protein [Gordonia hirsuta DSM 44140 = NBRC 16056]
MESVPRLAAAVWPELGRAPVTLVVPVGSVEQHGPHLPLDTDSRIGREVAARAVEALNDDDAAPPRWLLAPTIEYGASGEHEGFPGTVSIGTAALSLLLLELGRSACRWADRLLVVNAHGGNAAAVIEAVTTLRAESRDAAWFPCAFPGADAHAGHTETSVLLAIAPAQVRMDQAAPGNTAPIGQLLDVLRRDGVAAVSPNGVLGDPSGADAASGARSLHSTTTALTGAARRWSVGADGRLA